MNSSNHLATIDPWILTSPDPWIPCDAFARETESALTKALQQSFFNHHHHQQQPEFVSTTTTATVSGSRSPSVSEPETPGSKRRLGVSIAKSATKRKSRASKRSMTTFIQADPANFRQMVQQVTGVKIDGNGVGSLVKPEALRQPFVSKTRGQLPTLDTSAYLLNHQNMVVAPARDEGTDLYHFSSFPTLESSM